MVRRTGKYARVNPRKPEAMGICDRTGFLFNRKDLVKQMTWAGNRLVWTGWWVGRPFVDSPNQQSRPSILSPDPVPIPFPRPPIIGEQVWDMIEDGTWEFQGIPWKEENTSPTKQIGEMITGWGAPSEAQEALPGQERLKLLQQAYFGALEDQ